MTNSYNLSLRPKIIFIHGLNNNISSFKPIINHFSQLGYEVELIILPGHGNDRHKVKSLKDGLKSFENSMEHLKQVPYYIIAFSHGALYLELWLNSAKSHPPLKKVLLAPAHYLKRQKTLTNLFSFLPRFIRFKSFSPKAFRRYQHITAGEYRILMEGVKTFQNLKRQHSIPCLTIIDPKDELLDTKKLKQNQKNLVFIDRPYLNKGMGSHHIIFHPEYFSLEEWRNLTRKIEVFLEINVEA